jgi:hypothetical protein
MRSAKEPFGGGLDEVGAGLVAAGLATDFVAAAGLETVGLVIADFGTIGLAGAALAGGAVLVGVVLLLGTGFGEAGLTGADDAALGTILDIADEAAGRLERTLLAG